MLRNSKHAWGLIAISLHWIIALLIFAELALGTIAEGLKVSPQKFELFVWHKSIGITILLLVVFRIVWRLSNPTPVAHEGAARWEKRLAQLGHGLLYILMIAVPLTGWWVSDTSRIPFRWFWSVPVPDLMAPDRDLSALAATVHGILTKLLLLVVVLHIIAALRHHVLLRNDTLLRMLPSKRDEGS